MLTFRLLALLHRSHHSHDHPSSPAFCLSRLLFFNAAYDHSLEIVSGLVIQKTSYSQKLASLDSVPTEMSMDLLTSGVTEFDFDKMLRVVEAFVSRCSVSVPDMASDGTFVGVGGRLQLLVVLLGLFPSSFCGVVATYCPAGGPASLGCLCLHILFQHG